MLVLTGPSSSGKSVAAARLQLITHRPAVCLCGDDVDIPPDAVALESLRRDPGRAVAFQMAAYRGYYASLAAWAANGIHAIGETILKDEAQVEALHEQLAAVSYVVARLTARRDIRLRREAERGDRAAGITDETAEREVMVGDHKIEIDTSDLTIDEVAQQLLGLIEPPV